MTTFNVSSPPVSPQAEPGNTVAPATGLIPQLGTTTAIVVTHGPSAYLARTLAALRAQPTQPRQVLVVDTGPGAGTPPSTPTGITWVSVPRARTFGQAVDAVVEQLDQDTWLWLLHDDSRPAPDAFTELTRAVEHSSNVAIAGAKHLAWLPDPAEPAPLLQVGVTTTPWGRRETGIDDGEIDQGQYDMREDVLAVGLAGALVRRTVWLELAGTDPELGNFGDGLDFCRRARLAGHRVVVAPKAVVFHAQQTLTGRRDDPAAPVDLTTSFGARRRSVLHQRLAWAPAIAVPFLALGMLLVAPFAAMVRLTLKQPGAARNELLAPVWAIIRIGPLWRARRRAASTASEPRRSLRPLQTTWRQAFDTRRDANPEHQETRSDLDRAELRWLGVRRRVTLGGVVLALAGLSAAVFGPLTGTLASGGHLEGGALLPASTGLADTWRAVLSGWNATSLGAAVPADPFALVLALGATLTGGDAQLATNLIVLCSVLLAGLGAWFAAGAVTRSAAMRAWAVLVWIATPAATQALLTGRIGPLLVHMVLPWVALAVLRALGVQRQDLDKVGSPRPGSLGAAAAAGLLLVIAVAGAPMVFPVAAAAIAIAAVTVRRNRQYLPLILVPAAVLYAPFWAKVITTWGQGGWRIMFATPGLPDPYASSGAWELALGQPTTTRSWFGLNGLWATQYAPYAVGALLVILAVVAVLRAKTAAVAAWFVALVALVTVIACSTVVVAVAGSTTVTGWPGAAMSVMTLALLGAALLGLPRKAAARPAHAEPSPPEPVREPRGRRHGVEESLLDWADPAPPAADAASGWDQLVSPRGRRRARRQPRVHDTSPKARVRAVCVVAFAVVITAIPAAGLASWVTEVLDSAPRHVGELQATTVSHVPPAGRQMQQSPRDSRVLAVGLDGRDLTYTLWRGDGPQLVDASAVLAWQGLHGTESDGGSIAALVAGLATGGDGVAADLASHGVGAVLLPAATTSQERAELIAAIDTVPGLQRVTEGKSRVLWRVAPTTGVTGSWARTSQGDPVDADGRRIDTTIEAGTADRQLILAENADAGWRATLDGHRLKAVDRSATDGLQAFAVGAGGGRLVVHHTAPWEYVWVGLGALTVLVFVLMALPVRRRLGGR